MGLKKQEFYEGAALHLLARAGVVSGLRYEQPFFFLNVRTAALLKYSTKGRSPWAFTFTVDEQVALAEKATDYDVVVGLICGSDGIAALEYASYQQLVPVSPGATIHVACYRSHGEHYEVSGPRGKLNRKVSPSKWSRIISRGEDEAR